MIGMSGWTYRYPITWVPWDGPTADPASATAASDPMTAPRPVPSVRRGNHGSGRLPAARQFVGCDRGW
jgi:hypothetical protein